MHSLGDRSPLESDVLEVLQCEWLSTRCMTVECGLCLKLVLEKVYLFANRIGDLDNRWAHLSQSEVKSQR